MNNSSLLTEQQVVEKVAESRLSDYIVGSVYIIVSLAIIAVYLPCMLVMWKDKQLWSRSCYKLMFHLGVADLATTVLLHIPGGIMTIIQKAPPLWLNRLIGGTGNAQWYLYCIVSHVLAFDRFIHICMAPLANGTFGIKSTKVWIIFCYCYMGFFWLVFNSPYVGFIYYPSLYNWYIDYALPYSQTALDIGFYQNQFHLCMMAFWYVLVVGWIRAMRSHMSQSQLDTQRRENAVVKQTAALFIYVFLWEKYWMFAPYYLPMTNKYTLGFGNLLFLSNAAVNPIVYLTINKTIGTRVSIMLGLTKGMAVPTHGPQQLHISGSLGNRGNQQLPVAASVRFAWPSGAEHADTG